MSSIWKKEISLRRKPNAGEPELPPEPEAAQTGSAAAPVEVPIPALQREPEAAVLPAPSLPAGDYGWLTQDFDPDAVPDAMPSIQAPQVSAPAVSAPLPEPEVAAPMPSVAAPVVEVVAAAASTTAEAANVPFWKKEISVSRSAKEPKEPKEPKAAKVSSDEPKVPFWKKELSLSRSAKEPKQPKQPKEPKAAKVSSDEPKVRFWKKELSLSRSAKEPKQPKEPKAAKVGSDEPTVPFWKKELSLSLSREREPKVAGEPKVKDPRPIWKRELKFSRPKGEAKEKAPKVAKPPKQKAPGTIIGLKIGASQIAAARVSNGASPQLLQFARAELPQNVVVGGELRDIETLAQTLKDLFAKHKLPKKNVRLGIANNRIGVRTFEIPDIGDPKQLENAIRFRAQETLPIPLEEAVLDWKILSETTNEAGETMRRVLLVVAYRDLVERYVAACTKAGIKLSGIDLEAFAMLRALEAPTTPDENGESLGAQVVVNVGHDRSTFAVTDGRVCDFTRVLSWGGQNLSVAIARVLDSTPSEVLHIKHALSLVATAEPVEGISPETMQKARDAVVPELQSFARELVSSLRFYQNQPGSLGIRELVLTGGTAHLPGFSDELNRLIGVPVRVGDPLNRVAVPKRFREPQDCSPGSLTIAIGLGIED